MGVRGPWCSRGTGASKLASRVEQLCKVAIDQPIKIILPRATQSGNCCLLPLNGCHQRPRTKNNRINERPRSKRTASIDQSIKEQQLCFPLALPTATHRSALVRCSDFQPSIHVNRRHKTSRPSVQSSVSKSVHWLREPAPLPLSRLVGGLYFHPLPVNLVIAVRYDLVEGRLVAHGHEAEAAAAARLAVHHDDAVRDGPELAPVLAERGVVHAADDASHEALPGRVPLRRRVR